MEKKTNTLVKARNTKTNAEKTENTETNKTIHQNTDNDTRQEK